MSFQEKNTTVSLSIFVIILGFYLIRVFQMVQHESFNSTNVFRLWGIIIVLAVIGTILATILTHIAGGIIHKVRTNEDPHIEDIQDERDQIIDLKGTRVAYTFSSIGVALSMLTFVFGQPPLVMFTLLIFFGVLAQVVADIWRLTLYRRGF
jgi:DMSO reductase anchor subunit